MKLLWITPKWTLPANDGARVASSKLLRHIPKQDLEIDYFAMSHPDDDEDPEALIQDFKVSSADFIKRKMPKSKLLKGLMFLKAFLSHPLIPLTMASFNTNKIKRKLSDLIERNQYDYILIDGLHCIAPIIDLMTNQKILYRSHNVEADIWKRAANDTSNPLKKLLLYMQYKIMQRYEKHVLNLAYKVFPISIDDSKVYKNITSESKLKVISIGMDFSFSDPKIPKEKIKYLFLGRLDWPPNRDGLKWLLDNVWPNIDTNHYELHIAGSGNREWINAYKNLAGVKLHGYVEDLKDLYQEIDCSLIPIFYGSGTRIKIIESYAFDRPIISTKMGALGSQLVEGRDYIQCEDARDWIKALNHYKPDEQNEMKSKAREILKRDFDQNLIAQKLYESLV